MATVFAGLGLNQLGNESSYMKSGGSGIDPLSYMAGYALDKLTGGSDYGKQMMGQKPVAPTTPSSGAGLTQPTMQGGISPYAPTTGLSTPKAAIDPNTFTPIAGVDQQYPTYDFSTNNSNIGFNSSSPALNAWAIHSSGAR